MIFILQREFSGISKRSVGVVQTCKECKGHCKTRGGNKKERNRCRGKDPSRSPLASLSLLTYLLDEQIHIHQSHIDSLHHYVITPKFKNKYIVLFK